MRKIQTLMTFFERIFAWGHQNHPDPHCRCHSHPQTPICLCIFPTLLVPRARKVACDTADKQTTCSRPRGAACVKKKSLISSWAMDRTAPITVQGEKLVCAKLLCCESDVSIASARYGGCHWPPSWKPFCLIETESSVKASWFRTSGRYVVRWLHALKQSLRIDPLHMGAVRWDGVCNLTLSCRLRSSSERRIETKFSLQLETLDVCITIFLYSTCKRQARRKPSTPAIRCGGQAPVELTLKPRPRIKLRSRSTTWQLVVLVPGSTDTNVAKHMAISRNAHDLRWNNHVDYILTKATRLLSVLRRLRSSLDQESISHMYLTYIRPILEYACTAWGNQGTTQVDRLERFQRRATKIILRRPLFAPSNHDELLATIGWPSLASRRKYFQAVLGHCMATSNVPQHLRDYIPSRPTHSTTLENHLSSNSPLWTPL